MSTLNPNIVQEFNQATAQHRLVNKDTGQVTGWAHYRQIAVLDGHVSATGFYLVKEAVVSPEDFCKAIGVGVETPEPKEVQA